MKPTMRFLSVIFAVISVAVTLNGAPLTIVENGKSDYVILVPEKCLPSVKFAAIDLQTYIERATGARLPIVWGKTTKPAFMLGFPDKFGAGGFVARRDGVNLRISGDDSDGSPLNLNSRVAVRTGTWYGVCDFLEKWLGIRWIMPGDDGEFVPKTAKLVVDEFNYTETPYMRHRKADSLREHEPDKKRNEQWAYWSRRNRAGNVEPWDGSHSWLRNMRGEDYYKAHPEWFALVNGRRRASNGQYGIQICTTNADALDQLAANLIKDADGRKMLSLTPNDSGGMCECANCRALDTIMPDGSRNMSARMLTYADEVIKRVRRSCPNQKFGMYAYSNYTEPPKDFRPVAGLSMMYVWNNVAAGWFGQRAEWNRQNVLNWRKKLDCLYFYSYIDGMGNISLPTQSFRAIKELFQFLRQADVRGFDMDLTEPCCASGVNHYLYLKLAWNPDVDVDALYSDVLLCAYGEAAAPIMREFFAEVESRVIKDGSKKVRYDLDLGYSQRFPTAFALYEGLAEKFIPKIEAALAKTTDRGQKIRVEGVILNLKYTQTTLELNRAAQKLLRGNDRSQLKNCVKLSKQRDEYIAQMRPLPHALNLYMGIQKAENCFRLPFNTENFVNMSRVESQRSASAAYVQNVPKLTGKLDDEAWKNAPEFSLDYDNKSGEKYARAAKMRVLTTPEFLCVGVIVPEPSVGALTDVLTQQGSNVWDENSIDIYIDPTLVGKKYLQVVVNSLGTSTVVYHEGGKERVSKSTKVASKAFRGADYWSAEIRIPLKLICDGNPRGEIWGFNAYRQRRVTDSGAPGHEESAWNPTMGGLFNNPAVFGRLLLR